MGTSMVFFWSQRQVYFFLTSKKEGFGFSWMFPQALNHHLCPSSFLRFCLKYRHFPQLRSLMWVIEPEPKDIKDIRDIKDRLEVTFGEVVFPFPIWEIPGCELCPEQMGGGLLARHCYFGRNSGHSSFFILHSSFNGARV